MYIKKVTLTNVRCFEHVEFDLSSDHDVRKWGVILGDNGVGKTTLIRSIAMGLCDKTGAASLLQDTFGDWVRWDEKKATIKIDLLDGDKERSIKTTIYHESGSKLETVAREKDMENFPWKNMFVCAYGANRSIIGSGVFDRYSLADSIFSLFNYEVALQNPELMLRRRTKNQAETDEVCRWLDEVLMLEEGSTKLDEAGIKIKGNWGRHVYLGSAPDGHAATLSWVLDMLGWATLKGLKDQKNELYGIILIDEIEQHLHPKWQKYIIKLLHKVFPNLQFIATTHSPLCAIGTANCDEADEVCSLLALWQEDDHARGQDKIKPPSGQRADQVLTSYLFGLETTRSDDTLQRIERYSQLLAKGSRAETEEEELKELKLKLNKELGASETPLQEMVGKAVRDALDRLVDKITKGKKPPKEAVDFEIRRQLNELFGKSE